MITKCLLGKYTHYNMIRDKKKVLSICTYTQVRSIYKHKNAINDFLWLKILTFFLKKQNYHQQIILFYLIKIILQKLNKNKLRRIVNLNKI